jgi:hypothetical protein
MKTTKLNKAIIGLLVACLPTSFLTAQESSSSLSVGADVVSAATWRGARLAGVSVQPSISFETGGLSISAWGSTDLEYGFGDFGYTELDFTIGYSLGGVSVAVTDYSWTGLSTGFDYFGTYADNHIIELGVGVELGEYVEKLPISLSLNSMLYGANKTASNTQAYSSYFEAGYGYTLGDTDLSIAVGAALEQDGANMYSGKDGFNLVNISVGAAKSIPLTTDYSIGLFGTITYNPAAEGIFFATGVSF